MGTEMDSEAAKEKDLQNAFSKLCVDKKWETARQDDSTNKITELWDRCKQPFGGRECQSAATKVVKKRKSSSSPSKPYEAEWITSFQDLTFNSDSCCSNKCSCKKTSTQTSPRSKFNYSVAVSGSPRRFLRESRLKLHHSEKDRQQIIRAAKLKLLKLKRKEAPVNFERTKTNLPNISYDNIPIFGTKNSSKFQDFSNISGETDKAFNSSGNSFSSGSNKIFKNFSSNCNAVDENSEQKCQYVGNSSQESESMSSLKSEHFPDKSCSLEARVNCDEYTVTELASYFDDYVHIPKNMSSMAEMMYA